MSSGTLIMFYKGKRTINLERREYKHSDLRVICTFSHKNEKRAKDDGAHKNKHIEDRLNDTNLSFFRKTIPQPRPAEGIKRGSISYSNLQNRNQCNQVIDLGKLWGQSTCKSISNTTSISFIYIWVKSSYRIKYHPYSNKWATFGLGSG